MMPGYTTRHNASYDGFCQFSGGDTMQMEASIAAAAAVLEMFVQCVRGVIRVFSGLSSRFKNASFAGIRAEGAFLLSGIRENGSVRSVTVYSERNEMLRLVNPFGKPARIVRRNEVSGGGDGFAGDAEDTQGEVYGIGMIELRLRAGEMIELTEER